MVLPEEVSDELVHSANNITTTSCRSLRSENPVQRSSVINLNCCYISKTVNTGFITAVVDESVLHTVKNHHRILFTVCFNLTSNKVAGLFSLDVFHNIRFIVNRDIEYLVNNLRSFVCNWVRVVLLEVSTSCVRQLSVAFKAFFEQTDYISPRIIEAFYAYQVLSMACSERLLNNLCEPSDIPHRNRCLLQKAVFVSNNFRR